MEYKYIVDGKERCVKVETSGDKILAVLDDLEPCEFTVEPLDDNSILMKKGASTLVVRFARDRDGLHLMAGGVSITAKKPGEGGSGGGVSVELVDGKQVLVAPMPGQVVKVNVNVGDKVTKKQCCVIVEAMKMENELNTAIDGTITAIHVEAGQQVVALAPLVEITQVEKSE